MSAVAAPAARPRRRTSERKPLYEPLDWIVLRAPALPIEHFDALADDRVGDSPLARSALVRTALAVASPDLLAKLERPPTKARAAAKLDAKLRRYLVRMSTRPTPFGLFAGVALAEPGPVTDVRLSGDPRTRTRPDMAWLLAFVADVERRPEVRRALRVLVDGRAHAFGRERVTVGSTSVLATEPVRLVLERARAPVAWADLAAEVSTLPGATPEKAETLLTQLCERGVLLTDLRPPLTHPAPAQYVLDRLAELPGAGDAHSRLSALLDAMAAWDELPLRDRPSALARLTVPLDDGAGAAEPSGAIAQVDARVPLDGGRISHTVATEAARAGELMLRLSPTRGRGSLDAYRNAFAARYGDAREVPLLELLDPDLGLGPPGGHGAMGGVDARAWARRDRALRDLALGAWMSNEPVVELDERLIGVLELEPLDPQAAPVSLDVAVFVLAASRAELDAGRFQVLVGPNLGAQAAGRTLGRFADLLGAPARRALESVDAAEREHVEEGDVVAELVYLPDRARSANVAIRPSSRSHELAVNTTPGAPPEGTIRLDELVVALEGGRLVVRCPRLGARVRVTAGHMLNHQQAPDVVRFLHAVAEDGTVSMSGFDWGPAGAFGFLPRVQSGRVILAPAQWRLDAEALGGDAVLSTAEAFRRALERWRTRWMVPPRAYLAMADNRLLLDLERPAHVDQLRDELRSLPESAAVLIQEALPGPEHAWLPGPDGHHLSELVVPTVRTARPKRSASPPSPSPDGARAGVAVETAERMRLPGSDWLFLKLYGARDGDDELIAGALQAFCQFTLAGDLAQDWHFLRYSDPDPHVRLRFRGVPGTLVGRLMPAVCEWASELVESGTRTRFAFDTYEREIERYGGPAAMPVAEAIFGIDSRLAAQLLHLERTATPAMERQELVLVAVDALLAGLGLTGAERAAVCARQVRSRKDSGPEFRGRQPRLRELLGGDADDPALARVLGATRAALAPLGTRLARLEAEGRLHPSRTRICESLVHMTCNRLLGPDVAAEQRTLGLLLRTWESLERAPLDH